MGLVGMLVIEENRPHNHFAWLVPGPGRIQLLTKAVMEHYDREYSLVYMDIDDRLNRIPAAYKDPREIEKRMQRDYDSTQRQPNIFLVNGRSFPYTLRDSPIEVKLGEKTKLRILNAGARTMSLHTHGHHPALTHLDGYAVSEAARQTRDVFTIGPAQRIDLELLTGRDDVYASGPGVWVMHDHNEIAVTNKGIDPGGDQTAIVYDNFMTEEGLPKTVVSLDRFFDPEYYKRNVPVFNPKNFYTTRKDYEWGWPKGPPKGGNFSYPVREKYLQALPRLDLIDAQRHRIAASSCGKPRGFRRIHLKAGKEFAREGEVFAFEPRTIRAEPCEDVEIVLEILDSIRHDLMIPGLNPMFAINFTGPGTHTDRFVTPDEDVSLLFHCHVSNHEQLGMLGQLVVGKGGKPAPRKGIAKDGIYEGIGVVIATLPRQTRLVVDHEEITGFMAAMEMSYPVASAKLLQGLQQGDKIGFTIDAGRCAITAITPLEHVAGCRQTQKTAAQTPAQSPAQSPA